MDSSSVQAKNKEKVGEKRQRVEIEDISDTECPPLLRRSSRSKASKPPPIPRTQSPAKHAKPSTRSIVPVLDQGQEVGILPKLIFRREEIPPDGRLNIASKPDLICKVKKAIMDTQEWDIILASQFAKLFQLQTALAATSGKVIHQFCCRMLITMKKHEIWFVFGGKPMRFGLTEFANVTGLNCGPLPPPDKVKEMKDTPKGQQPYWETLLGPLFGPKRPLNVTEVSDLLLAEKNHPGGRYLTSNVRLTLSLLVLIDGVIAPNQSAAKVRDETCEMLKDLDAVLSYAWGRESFNNTLRMLIWGEEYKTVAELKSRLCMQSHLSIHGFPLTIQLAIFKSIPKLHSLLPKNKQTTELIDPEVDTVGYLRNIRTDGINAIEDSDDLLVHPYIDFGFDLFNDDLSWDDERQDPHVDTMVERIRRGFKFERIHWQVWGQKVLRNISPRKQIAGGQTPRTTTAKQAGSSMSSKEGPSERYVEEELVTVPPIDWGYPDETVPGLMKWLEDEQEGDLTERTKWWEEQRDRDLADRKRWWSSFGERLLASYCTYHSEKGQAKGEQVDGQKINKEKNLGSVFIQENVEEPGDKQITCSQAKQAASVGVGDVVGEQVGNEDHGTSIKSQDVDWEQLEAEMGQIQQANIDNQTETGYVTPPRLLDVDLPDVEQCVQPTNPIGQIVAESSSSSSTDDDEAVKGIDKRVEVTNLNDEPNRSSSCEERMDVSPRSQRTNILAPEVQIVESQQKTLEASASQRGDEEKVPTSLSDHVEHVEDDSEVVHQKGADVVHLDDEARAVNLDDDKGTGEDYLLENPLESDDDQEEPIGDLLQPGGELLESTYPDATFDQDDSEQTENKAKESSGTKKRDRRKPKRLVEETSGKKPARGKKKLAKVFLSTLNNEDGSEYTVNNLQVTKKFFEQLYTPSNHVANEHIEAVLSVIWNRHSERLLRDRVAILDTLFTAAVVDDYKHFQKLRSEMEQRQFRWNKVIQRYVTGDVEGRGCGLAWITEVDEVYMPMYWKKHWVAISINLRTGWVHIMDSNIAYTKKAKVKELMMPLLTSLPHILRAYVDQEKCKYDIPQEFVYERVTEVPQNARSGDCGLLSVMFIERLCQNLTLEDMDDAAVDKMRMSYAIQVFECFVKPLRS